MKNGGKALVGIGVALVIGAMFWRATGVYTSQGWLFLGLLGVAIAALWIGGKMTKDANSNQVVDWKPSDSNPETPEPAATPQPPTLPESVVIPQTGETMNCPQCGNSTQFGANECATCGAGLDTSAIIMPPPAFSHQPAVPEPTSTNIEQHDAPDVIAPPPGMIASPPTFSAPPAPVEQPPVQEVGSINAAHPGPPPPQPTSEPAEDLDATRTAVRRRSGSPWRLVLPKGPDIVVDGSVLIGRDPAPHANWPGAQLLCVDDNTNSLSKTHAAIESNSHGLWATDLGSTNGVVAVRADGTEVEAEGDQPVKLAPGWDLELGDFIIQIEKD